MYKKGGKKKMGKLLNTGPQEGDASRSSDVKRSYTNKVKRVYITESADLR